jgi:hypothetical protein
MHVASSIHLILLDFIILLTFDKKCKLWSCSLCNFLQSPVTSSLLPTKSYSQTKTIYVLPVRCINFNRFKTYICVAFFYDETKQCYLIKANFLKQYLLLNKYLM